MLWRFQSETDAWPVSTFLFLLSHDMAMHNSLRLESLRSYFSFIFVTITALLIHVFIRSGP
jgi:hypothetical protein